MMGFLAVPDEDCVFALRPHTATLGGPVMAVWEQEDPWGVSGLLGLTVDRDGTWFDLTEDAFGYLRGTHETAPEFWLADTPSQHQPSTVEVIDGGNAAVSVQLGGLGEYAFA